MMKLKEMTATFGKLERAHLEFGPGLNLIEAPNEGGKSTWCAFWKAMLYGIDTRDRDKKGRLADKNRFQPWSGAPMEGELRLELDGRDVTIRRGPRGNTPFGAFSAVYTATGEAVPGLTADGCGALLTGVGREVFERSAFLGSGGLAVTAAPELEVRIAALVSSGEEEVSFSQTEGRLRDWLNRRKVNRSVGLIPKLEQELAAVQEKLEHMAGTASEIAGLEAAKKALEAQKRTLEGELATHRKLEQQGLNARFAQAQQDYTAAQTQLKTLESELSRFGEIPPKEELKKAQGELQYLKVLDEEIKSGESALKDADAAYVQAQIAIQDEKFSGLSGEDALRRAENDRAEYDALLVESQKKQKKKPLFWGLGVILFLLFGGLGLFASEPSALVPCLIAAPVGLLLGLLLGFLSGKQAKAAQEKAAHIWDKYGVDQPDKAQALAEDYAARCATAQQAAEQTKTVRGALNDRKARRENCKSDLLAFVHTFAPEVRDLFGCSAALSRALGLDHELAMARDRVQERQRRRDDLAAQGGQEVQTLELLTTPVRSPQECHRLLTTVQVRLEEETESLNQALGRQAALGDPAALAARKEELETELRRRQTEYEALSAALEGLHQANQQLQERFSPALNRLAGQYMARLTGNAYTALAFNRELEGSAARTGDVLPHSALYLSRGAADQMYLALRLAVCQLCLPEKPPLVLDDALTAFDDRRLALALDLLRELAQERQILLFTCQRRERDALLGAADVRVMAL